MATLSTPYGSFQLTPRHHNAKLPLQAWNAADELMLAQVAELHPDHGPQPNVLIVNDLNGALGIGLNRWQPLHWNDSFNSKLSLQHNTAQNQLEWREDHWLPLNEPLNPPSNQPFNLVLIKIPKSLALLEFQLNTLRSVCSAQTQIIGGAMVKHLSGNMIGLFEKILGPTHTSLAKKKARLVLSQLRTEPGTAANNTTPTQYSIPGTELTLQNHASVFSQQKLDLGTRFLLEHFPDVSRAETILDLGCGNGALGIYAASKNPNATVLFTDESYLAIKSAQESYALNGLTNPSQFFLSDCLQHPTQTIPKVDLVLCNPPFHQGNNVESQTALRMFANSKKALTPGGKIVVVGNRHLNYHQSLKRFFRNTTLLASNKKFVILQGQI